MFRWDASCFCYFRFDFFCRHISHAYIHNPIDSIRFPPKRVFFHPFIFLCQGQNIADHNWNQRRRWLWILFLALRCWVRWKYDKKDLHVGEWGSGFLINLCFKWRFMALVKYLEHNYVVFVWTQNLTCFNIIILMDWNITSNVRRISAFDRFG